MGEIQVRRRIVRTALDYTIEYKSSFKIGEVAITCSHNVELSSNQVSSISLYAKFADVEDAEIGRELRAALTTISNAIIRTPR